MFSNWNRCSLFVVALLAIAVNSKHVHEKKTDCSDTCNFNERCNPYVKENVWALVGNFCQVFQNDCYLSLENCQRENECESKLTSIPQEECQKSCPNVCTAVMDPVCASFATVNDAGENVIERKTFNNICLLNEYSCENGEAYLNEPTSGACN